MNSAYIKSLEKPEKKINQAVQSRLKPLKYKSKRRQSVELLNGNFDGFIGICVRWINLHVDRLTFFFLLI